jgi:hypothetical protein
MFSLLHSWRIGQNQIFLEVRGMEGRGKKVGSRGEKWPKQYIHI